jgi:hypothetical protein
MTLSTTFNGARLNMQPIITVLHISAKLQIIFEGMPNTQGSLSLHEVEKCYSKLLCLSLLLSELQLM